MATDLANKSGVLEHLEQENAMLRAMNHRFETMLREQQAFITALQGGQPAPPVAYFGKSGICGRRRILFMLQHRLRLHFGQTESLDVEQKPTSPHRPLCSCGDFGRCSTSRTLIFFSFQSTA
eukprot:evm.model.scf_365.2 EVM.evm.TU.scf_365.2   scf_365:50633-50998(+)